MINNIPSIYMRFPEGKGKALTFSYDDGMILDPRLIGILDKNNLKATFKINSGIFYDSDKIPEKYSIYRRMTKEKVIETYANTPHEVAIHGFTHSFLETLPSAAVVHEVLHDRERLEALFGKIIRGMAYPYGTYNDNVIEALRACGILYARTVRSTGTFDIPTDWLRLPATCHHADPRLMELAEKFTKMETKRHSQLFYVWGHSYEFGEADNWNVIEEFAEYMSGRDDIWYATNIEIFEYIEDFKRLIYSADCSIVRNPTNRTLYFSLNNVPNVIAIKPGETLKLY